MNEILPPPAPLAQQLVAVVLTPWFLPESVWSEGPIWSACEVGQAVGLCGGFEVLKVNVLGGAALPHVRC